MYSTVVLIVKYSQDERVKKTFLTITYEQEEKGFVLHQVDDGLFV